MAVPVNLSLSVAPGSAASRAGQLTNCLRVAPLGGYQLGTSCQPLTSVADWMST